MAETVIIHGYGAGITPSTKDFQNHLGFAGFSEAVNTQDAVVYQWLKVKRHNFWDWCNPKLHLETYKAEKLTAASDQEVDRLRRFLEAQQPKRIICHSLGCYLLLNLLRKHDLPKSVKTIIFCQADLPRNINKFLSNEQLSHLTQSIHWYNFYCPWDPALATSCVLNKSDSAGMLGFKCHQITNKFSALLTHPNLHTATITNKKFAQLLLKL